MCDIYTAKCEMCENKVEMHIGDYSTERSNVKVICHECKEDISTLPLDEDFTYQGKQWATIPCTIDREDQVWRELPGGDTVDIGVIGDEVISSALTRMRMTSTLTKREVLQRLSDYIGKIWAGAIGINEGMGMKKTTPQKLAEDILHRSKCNVMVGAVIADRHGIFAWAWNNAGAGDGIHAEAWAINRSNRKRLGGASIYVAGVRKSSWNPVNARPCDDCMGRIRANGISRVYYRDKDATWKMEVVK